MLAKVQIRVGSRLSFSEFVVKSESTAVKEVKDQLAAMNEAKGAHSVSWEFVELVAVGNVEVKNSEVVVDYDEKEETTELDAIVEEDEEVDEDDDTEVSDSISMG